MKKGLNRTQLKLIAIVAMVCDHTAWGFLDFMNPLALLMHCVGRLTLPIMCFFIAEGYRHTADKKRYIGRMASFWIVSVIPFYLFFHEVYDYRQNIIFDLMLGLLMLDVLESKKCKVWQKVLLGAGLFMVSAVVGGWVIMPILFILVFYYVRDFRKQAGWICGLTITMVLFLVTATSLNQIWHFSHYDWVWYEELYLLGFMLPLIFLRHYNGEKGKEPFGRYFFYLFYPAHFLILYFGKIMLAGITIQEFYVGIHIAALLVCLGILFIVLFARPSRGQSGTLLLVLSSCVYIFGFIIEITSSEVSAFYAATLMQYFGECTLMIGFTFFVAEMCHREVPPFLYVLEGLCGILVMWMLLTTKQNHIFYLSMDVGTDGPFPRFVLERGWGFGVFVVYMAVVCVGCFITCLIGMKQSKGIERKRIMCTAAAILCPWVPNFIRDAGLTGGYEVPCFGVAGAVILIGLALLKYGYFDSIALAGENALNHGQEGIMVISTNHAITYYNKRMEEIFGRLVLKQDAYQNKLLESIFEGKQKILKMQQQIYEMRVEALTEGGYEQGRMLWVLDITEHHDMMIKLNDLANKDALTGIYNRSCFKERMEKLLAENCEGALFMMDLDNFKQINDRFGHQEGDKVLAWFGEVLQGLGEDTLPCRIGGDEFCLFYKKEAEDKELGKLAESIAGNFVKKTEGEKYAGITTVSIGIARVHGTGEESFEQLYSNADKALYVAKNRSKNTYYIL